ncbi:MAG: type II toxin-antitoxin system mRNA interferase toxin, RelE/StbE family [Candidatus Gracilibacteria bacterium]|jgi:addiction module RelE/StbE family toxin
MKIIYSPQFLKKYRRLSKEIKDIAKLKEVIFKNDCFDTRLRTHKLHGRLNNLWAFSLSSKYRIVFEVMENESVIFHTVGTHDIYE